MTKFFKKLHRILGLLAGVIIFLSCLTGAILVFQDEIREIVTPERYFHEHKYKEETPISLNELVQKVNAQLQDDHVNSIKISSETRRNYIVSTQSNPKNQIFVDPYTAEIKGKIDRSEPDFFGYSLQLHRWLMDDSRTWGKQIMGASTILFVFILVSGIVYWWPKSKKALKQRLSIKTKASRQRLITDLHASLGIYCVSLLLLLALTGLTWSYPWYRSGLYSILGIESPKEKGKEKKVDKTDIKSDVAFDWDTAYQNIKKTNQKATYVRLEIGKAHIKRPQIFGNVRAEDSYKLDPLSASIQEYIPYETKPSSDRARGWIYSLHLGLWGGLGVKLIYFVVCLMGASFFPTGLWLYLKRRPENKVNVKAKTN